MDKINDKKSRYKLLTSLNLMLSIVLTLIGSISIVGLIILLYEIFNISLFFCLSLDILLPQIYGYLCKFITGGLDNKIVDAKIEINRLEKEYTIERKIGDILSRTNNLSIERQVEVLKYIRNDLMGCNMFGNIDLLDRNNVKLIEDNLEKEIKKRTLKISDNYRYRN